MAAETFTFQIESQGGGDSHDITGMVKEQLENSQISAGILNVFTASSTSAITTIEYESGALADFQRMFNEVSAQNRHYEHNARWGDGNGHSHVRAALLGPSLSIPVVEGKLTLGTWQQIVFIDFDNKARLREIIVQIVG
jgi:secondary thiamine-phosphate synthase enzyme